MNPSINRNVTFLAAASACVFLLAACQQRTEDTSSGASDTGMTQSGSEHSATSDIAITAKVKTALLADSKVKSMDIHVETEKGEVILSGFVDSETQIDEAIKVASNINGVKKVTNKMKGRK